MVRWMDGILSPVHWIPDGAHILPRRLFQERKQQRMGLPTRAPGELYYERKRDGWNDHDDNVCVCVFSSSVCLSVCLSDEKLNGVFFAWVCLSYSSYTPFLEKRSSAASRLWHFIFLVVIVNFGILRCLERVDGSGCGILVSR